MAMVDWKCIGAGNAGASAAEVTDVILDGCRRYIPRRTLHSHHSTHPWLDARCRQAVASKCRAEGGPHYAVARDRCTRILLAAFRQYQSKLRTKLAELPCRSKLWWRLNRELLQRVVSRKSVPPLQAGNGLWVTTPADKAELLAGVLRSRCHLPPMVHSHDLQVPAEGAPSLGIFLPIRKRVASKVLRQLREDTASGPDCVPVRVLCRLHSELAWPCAMLARACLADGTWPQAWREHWVCPLHKRGPAHDPGNYRCIHLTPILAKVVERIIGATLTAFLMATGAYGPNQWAYQCGRSCRDLVALLVASWLLAFEAKLKVGILLADIAGAFDKVPTPILMNKLIGAGVGDRMAAFLHTYLAPRSAVVVVPGGRSAPFPLQDTVFQGSVLGPHLWNVFAADVRDAVIASGATEAAFADDLTVSKAFDLRVGNEEIRDRMRQCQSAVHG